jgi:predicted ribosome quality control (RQC) complex YloA/Tae2 family protein
MPLDSLTISALVRELSPALCGAKIDKVQQPARDMLLLSIRTQQRGNVRLAVSGGVGSARLHLTEESFDNPQSPPMFCMLMRKHLIGARIASLYQPEHERMVVLELDAFDEMGVPVAKKLIVEMIGRGTNIILVGGDGRIIDCLRRVDAEMNPARQVLPGLIYRLPPKQDKPEFFDTPSERRRELWSAADEEKTADRWLTDIFSGLSPVLAREMCFRAFGDTAPRILDIPPSERGDLPRVMDAFSKSAENGEFVPVMLVNEGRPKDFYCTHLTQFTGVYESREESSFSSLLDVYYTRRDKADDIKRRAQSLTKSVKNAHDRVVRKLELQRSDLKSTEGREEKRKFGELITANIYRMKKGEKELRTEDYYDEACPVITIPLDPLKTPQQNAAAYYKEYNKAKSAEQHLTALIEKGERDLEYLKSVLDELARAENDRDLAEIRRELTQTGYLRRQKNSGKEKVQEQKPMRFVSSSGLEILVGRNNAQNDKLTLKTARKTDVWFHTQKIHGSHVILRTEGETPDAQSISECAVLAAYYSQGRESGKIPVDFTLARYVKKPSGALPGMVIYTDYSTIMAQPDEKLVESLKK